MTAGLAAAALSAAACAWAPAAHAERSGRIKTPAPTVKCLQGSGYVTVEAFGEAWLTGRPLAKPLSVSSYIKVTTELQAQAGANGTMWKRQASQTSRSDKSYYPSRAVSGGPLPVYTKAQASSNYAQGSSNYRAKLTVRVYREGPGIDGLTNRRVMVSNTITCSTPDGADLPPAPTTPDAGGGEGSPMTDISMLRARARIR